MTYEEIKVYKCTCNCCGHSWTTRKLELPEQCPKCHNPRWNKTEDNAKQPRLNISM